MSKESKSYAELEADLFLAERAFKRVPSSENEQALASVKKAFDALANAKAGIASEKSVAPNVPAAPKVTAAKAPAAKPAGKPAAKPAVIPNPADDSKKN